MILSFFDLKFILVEEHNIIEKRDERDISIKNLNIYINVMNHCVKIFADKVWILRRIPIIRFIKRFKNKHSILEVVK